MRWCSPTPPPSSTCPPPAPELVLDLHAALAGSRITGFEEIVLPGAQVLVLGAGDVAAFEGELLVSTGAAGRVELVGAWQQGDSRSIDGVSYRVFASGA